MGVFIIVFKSLDVDKVVANDDQYARSQNHNRAVTAERVKFEAVGVPGGRETRRTSRLLVVGIGRTSFGESRCVLVI